MELGILKKLNNSKGVTLTELLVSIAILAVVAAPFLGSFTAAARTNVVSETRLGASNIAQKAMEEIKAKMDLASELGAAEKEADNDYQPSDPRYRVYYSVDDVSESEWKTLNIGEDNFDGNSDAVLDSNLKFEIGIFPGDPDSTDDSIKFTGTATENIDDGLDEEYLLTLSKVGSDYYYRLETRGDSAVLIDSSEFEPGSEDISIKIQFSESLPDDNDSFKLYVKNNVDPDDYPVRCYVVDNKGNYLSLVNDGDYEFFQYGVSTRPSYNNVLYRITIVVKKDGTEVEKLVSYIKK